MPIYACYSGDVDNLPLANQECFFVTDSSGRKWVCHETDESAMTNEGGFGAAFGMMSAQQKSAKLTEGTGQGSGLTILRCEGVEALKSELARQ